MQRIRRCGLPLLMILGVIDSASALDSRDSEQTRIAIATLAEALSTPGVDLARWYDPREDATWEPVTGAVTELRRCVTRLDLDSPSSMMSEFHFWWSHVSRIQQHGRAVVVQDERMHQFRFRTAAQARRAARAMNRLRLACAGHDANWAA